MFSKKSIRGRFIIQLVATSVALVGVLSIILFYYIKNTVYEDLISSMENQAILLTSSTKIDTSKNIIPEVLQRSILHSLADAKIVSKKDKKSGNFLRTIDKDGKEYLTIYRPFENNLSKYVAIKQELYSTHRLLNKILQNIVAINALALVAIVFYALFLSRMLLVPIKTLASKLAKMNEKYLNHVDTKDMYGEFMPLGESLNRLIDRVQTFIQYQTEFFVGVAHELKTPLAVMKTKNEVTLMKERNIDYYKESLSKNIDSVNEMNEMISAILEIGRQEGAQLQPPTVVDLVTFVKEKSNGFKILAKQQNKDIALDIRPSAFPTLTQPTLVLHVLQNFVQNAIKFSPEHGIVTIQTRGDDDGFTIEVLDEGCGLNENIDIFAPFKRVGEQSGIGLGLFLAKGAAQALNAKMSVKNRKDKKGTIATLFIPRQAPIK